MTCFPVWCAPTLSLWVEPIRKTSVYVIKSEYFIHWNNGSGVKGHIWVQNKKIRFRDFHLAFFSTFLNFMFSWLSCDYWFFSQISLEISVFFDFHLRCVFIYEFPVLRLVFFSTFLSLIYYYFLSWCFFRITWSYFFLDLVLLRLVVFKIRFVM